MKGVVMEGFYRTNTELSLISGIFFFFILGPVLSAGNHIVAGVHVINFSYNGQLFEEYKLIH